MESQESFASLFEDQVKYNAIMNALSSNIHSEAKELAGKNLNHINSVVLDNS